MTSTRPALPDAVFEAAASGDPAFVQLVVGAAASLTLTEISRLGLAIRRTYAGQISLEILSAYADALDALAEREPGWSWSGQASAWAVLARACGDHGLDLIVDSARADESDVRRVRKAARVALMVLEDAASAT